MSFDPRLDSIPKGHTCPGVYRAIIEYLLESDDDFAGQSMLDIPCGRGELMSTLRTFFPKADVYGADIEKPHQLSAAEFSVVDASKPFSIFTTTKLDFVFCVSGVMEFDNTLQFFEQCHNCLRNGGQFIVTNDNTVSVRDRLAFFWLATFRQFHLFNTQRQPTWKVLHLNNMVRILLDAGFAIHDIRYISMKPKDWLMLPFALLIYPVQWLYIRFANAAMPLEERFRMYPFKALLHRHYMIICKKTVQ